MRKEQKDKSKITPFGIGKMKRLKAGELKRKEKIVRYADLTKMTLFLVFWDKLIKQGI